MKKSSVKPPTDETASASEPPAELGKNQAAFLTGFYAFMPIPSSVTEPLLVVCGALPIARLILLDHALSLYEEYTTEEMYYNRAESELRSENYDAALSARLKSLWYLESFQKDKVREIARMMWPGQSELRDWYLVGIAVGDLIAGITDCLRSIVSCQNARSTSAADIIGQTKQHLEKLSDKWEPLLDKAGALTRSACKRTKSRTAPEKLIEAWSSCKQFVPPDAGSMVDLQASWGRIHTLVRSASTMILDSDDRSVALDLPNPRDQFVYEQMMVHLRFGTTLQAEYASRIDAEGWEPVTDPDKFREIARKHAQRWGLAAPWEQPPGRPTGT